MKYILLNICIILSVLTGSAAVDIPISFHNRTDINNLNCIEDGEVYIFTTTGADPYVSSDASTVSTTDHSILSFEYIAEEGIDAVQVFFSSPASEAFSTSVGSYAPTTTWKTANINLKNNLNWEAVATQKVFRIDLGNVSGKIIKIRNVVMKATLKTPITLNTSAIINLTASEAAGVYTLVTTGTNPYINANYVDITSAKQFILSFDYIADAGIDTFKFYFFANDDTLSEDKSAILSNVAVSASWKNIQINLKNSNGFWNKKAIQSNFRMDVGTISGKTIKLRNISIIDGSGLLTNSFPIKLASGTEKDLTITEPVTNTWNINTTGLDPNIATVGFSEMYNPSLVKYISFEYKSTTGLVDMDAYFYKPTNGEPVSVDAAYVVNSGEAIPAAANLTEYVIDMSKSAFWKDAGTFRFDFGFQSGKDFQIKNIKLSDSVNIPRIITYYTQGGAVINALTTNYNAINDAPVVPLRLGYEIEGWYLEPEYTNLWNFKTTHLKNNISLYAKWYAVNPATVTFNSQDGSAIADITTNENRVIDAPQAPTKPQFEFGGWYKEAGGINAWDFEKDSVKGNTTLYAKWVGYSVYFDSRNGDVITKITADYNTTIVAPTAPTKTGLTFDGWYKEFLCINAWNFATDKVLNTTTLYARWLNSKPILDVNIAPSHLKYVGYYLIDTYVDDIYDGIKKSDYTDEVEGFTNLNHLAVFSPTDNAISRVNAMAAKCMKPFLGIEPIFFYESGKQPNENRKFSLFADYQTRWSTFKSINSSVLTADKIGCFYMADEPEWNGISYSDFNKVCQLVKSDFPSIPTLYIEAYPMVGTMQIPTSIDWVGFDRYLIPKPSTNGNFKSDLATIKTKLSTLKQKIFLVPETQWRPLDKELNDQDPEDMDATILDYYNLAASDSTIIGLICYEWPGGFDGPGSLGARNLPQNAIDVCVKIGKAINANNPMCITHAPPTAPSGLNVSDIALRSFVLSWTAVPESGGVTTYEVWKNGVYFGSTTSNSILVNTLYCGTTYSITVKARYVGSLWGAQSAALQVSTLDCIPCTLPNDWTVVSIGTTQQTICENAGSFTLEGTGTDAANNAYNFRYVYKTLTGDGAIIAKVESIENSDPWARVGVMIRETLSTSSKHADCYVTTANGVSFQVKSATTSRQVTPDITAPCWVKVARVGDSFSAYYSKNGIDWTKVGNSKSITMASSVYVGITATGSSLCTTCFATITNVSTDGTTAINTLSDSSPEITILPNPAKYKLTIDNLPKDTQVTIYTIDGKLINKVKPNNTSLYIDVTTWNKGVYLFHIQSANSVIIKKAIVE